MMNLKKGGQSTKEFGGKTNEYCGKVIGQAPEKAVARTSAGMYGEKVANDEKL